MDTLRADGGDPAHEPLPATWEEAHPGNVCGRASALTTLAPMSAWRARRLGLVFWYRRLLKRVLPGKARRNAAPLLELSFIHFAQWALIPRLPAGEGSAPEPLGCTYLLFETNFNGGFDRYIDGFSYVIPDRMKLFFGGCYGFPGPQPAVPFKRYIERHAFEAAHYYSAYPQATVTMVVSALQVSDRLAAFVDETRGMSAERFARRWKEFLEEMQGCL